MKSHWAVLFLFLSFLVIPAKAFSQLTVAQISDIHIGERHSPQAASQLERVVKSVNALHPDLVLVTGDIGENPGAWQQAKSILKGLHAPVKWVPGNHDVHTMDVERYRKVFGADYYTFEDKDITFVVIDSQLLGNYEHFDSATPPPLPAFTQQQSDKMLQWLASLVPQLSKRKVVIGVQHIPVLAANNFPPDRKPYWVISEPYRSEEMKLLKKMGIHDMLVGHWHRAMIFDAGGITWHEAPATSWLPWGGFLGFALHKISNSGHVSTQFFDLDGNPMGQGSGTPIRAETSGQEGSTGGGSAKGSGKASSATATAQTACPAPGQRGVNICSPKQGATLRSPVQITAGVNGSGPVKVTQVYVDGQKATEIPGDHIEAEVPLAAGPHRVTVQGLDTDGFFKTSVNITVR